MLFFFSVSGDVFYPYIAFFELVIVIEILLVNLLDFFGLMDQPVEMLLDFHVITLRPFSSHG